MFEQKRAFSQTRDFLFSYTARTCFAPAMICCLARRRIPSLRGSGEGSKIGRFRETFDTLAKADA